MSDASKRRIFFTSLSATPINDERAAQKIHCTTTLVSLHSNHILVAFATYERFIFFFLFLFLLCVLNAASTRMNTFPQYILRTLALSCMFALTLSVASALCLDTKRYHCPNLYFPFTLECSRK